MRTERAPALCTWMLCGLSMLFAAGCALTSKSEALLPRYFSPEQAGDSARVVAKPTDPPAELRLGRVSSAAYLDDRILYRDSAYELGYYSERLWTETPDQYLKRRVARVLFEERGIRQVVSGPAPTLELELVAFEEVRAPSRVARVQAIVRLSDGRTVRWEETLTADQPVDTSGKGDAAAATVDALGKALRTLVDRIAERTTTELAAAMAASAKAAAEAVTPLGSTAGRARRP